MLEITQERLLNKFLKILREIYFFLRELFSKRLKLWAERPNRSKSFIIVVSILVLLLGVRCYSLYKSPPTSIFTLSAYTSFVLIESQGQKSTQKWRINDAIICTQRELPSHSLLKPSKLNKNCGNQIWKEYESSDPELTLEIEGDSTSIFEVDADSSLHLAVRSNQTKESLSPIKITVNNKETLPIGSKINLVWLKERKEDFNYLIFPFTGAISVGNDINWATHGILVEGKITICGADFFSSNKRKQIDQTELVLGDKVMLGSTESTAENPAKPAKGFVRYSFQNDKPVFETVGFGEANQVKIERYGDYGIDFKPSFFTYLINDRYTLILLSFITFVASAKQFFQ